MPVVIPGHHCTFSHDPPELFEVSLLNACHLVHAMFGIFQVEDRCMMSPASIGNVSRVDAKHIFNYFMQNESKCRTLGILSKVAIKIKMHYFSIC